CLEPVPSDLKPVYLLSGSDRPKIRRALQRLRARVGEDAVELLSAVTASGEDAAAACNSLGLFAGGARLVLVEDVERWKGADAKAIASYLESPAPETVLALVASELRRDAPLVKICAKAGDHLCYDVSRRDLPRWVGEQFARRGADADRGAWSALVEHVGEDIVELETEIDKLATWAAGTRITEREVALLTAGRAEAPIFALTDAWGRRDLPGTLALCEELLERGGEPRMRALPRLAATIAAHVERVRMCQELAAEAVRPRDAAGRLKIHPYAAEKAFAHAESYSADELQTALVRLADLDRALKGGSRLAGDLELERTLIEITR
ncbi:MAG: DNA polymerase III subunit delta, partial [Actinomycetota bacterium]|nr:DNA polymerase III subunit delta [Actinomycetota bacterium]